MNSNLKNFRPEDDAKRCFGPGLLLVFATLAAYWPAYSAGFIWDDDDYVTQNRVLRDLNGLWQIWFQPEATPQYYPMVHTSFWLDYHLWGLNPLGFHVVNVLLHAVAAILFWRVLVRLNLPGAWLAAGVFALHPVQVESVAWITERKNVLSAVFYFSAMLCYLRFAGLGGGDDERSRREVYYFSALGLFVAALLSKTVACSLPAAALLICWWKKERLSWRDILPLGPFFLIGLSLGFLTAWLEKHHVGARGADWSLTFTDRSLVAGRALCFYAGKLAWPVPLTFIYPRWVIEAGLWWQWLYPGVVLTLVAGLWLARHRLGKGPLAAVLFFGGTLLPALGFINIYPMRFSFVADHFQYLASAGMFALAAVMAVRLADQSLAKGVTRTILAGGLLLILGSLTWHRCCAYRNLETLWVDTLEKNPGCWMAHSNLGRLLAQDGRYGEAEAHYQTAMAIRPDQEAIHYNYANLLARTGRLDGAIGEYQRALQLVPDKADTHNNLGSIYFREHRLDEAVAEFQSAIRDRPDSADAYFNLGSALAARQEMDAAKAAYQQALRLEPDSEVFRKRLQSLGVPAN